MRAVVTPGRSEPRRRRREREAEPDQVVGRIADHRLVEVAHQEFDLAVGVGDRPDVAQMAVAADPDRRPGGQAGDRLGIEPLVELERAAADEGVCRTRHLQLTGGVEDRLATVPVRRAERGGRFHVLPGHAARLARATPGARCHRCGVDHESRHRGGLVMTGADRRRTAAVSRRCHASARSVRAPWPPQRAARG